MQAPLYQTELPDTSRKLSAGLWRQKLQDYCSNDPQFGVRLTDDFNEYVAGITGTTAATANQKWSGVDAAAAGGTYSVTTEQSPDGIAVVASNGTTNHFGVELQSHAVFTTPKHTTAADRRGDLVFEARVNFGTADTVFVGLTEPGANFLSATSTLPNDSDFVGFYTVDNGATVTFYCRNDNNGGTAVEKTFNVSDYIESGYNKLGFRINKDGSVEVGVNGYWLPKSVTGITATSVPIEDLVARLSATAGGGTTAPSIKIDRLDLFVAAA